MLSRRSLLGGLLACIPLFGMKRSNDSLIHEEHIDSLRVRFKVNKTYLTNISDKDVTDCFVKIKCGDTALFRWRNNFSRENINALCVMDSYNDNGTLYFREYVIIDINSNDFEIFYG